MRLWVLLLTAIALSACNSTTRDGTPIENGGSLFGALKELGDPGGNYRARTAADDRKCREFGFNPGTEAYGACRLKLEQIRATERANNQPVRVKVE